MEKIIDLCDLYKGQTPKVTTSETDRPLDEGVCQISGWYSKYFQSYKLFAVFCRSTYVCMYGRTEGLRITADKPSLKPRKYPSLFEGKISEILIVPYKDINPYVI